MSNSWILILIVILPFIGVDAKESPHNGPRVRSLHVTSEVQYRFASTLVTCQMANEGGVATQGVFDVVIPSNAFISNFSVEVGGRVYNGEVREREAAEKEHTKPRRRGHTSSHVHKPRPRDTNRFKIEVNIAAQSTVTFHLTYQEVLQRRFGIYRHVIYLDPGQSVADFRVDVAIHESRDLNLLRVLPIKSTNLITDVDISGTNEDATVTQQSRNTARIRYRPSLERQQNMSAQGITGSLIIEYDVTRGKDAGDVLVVNGYFVHFFAPAFEDVVAKDVLFILDTSSSMAIRKMEQLRVAMAIILKDLRTGDRFNILEFNTETGFWQQNQLVSVSEENVETAVSFVKQLESNGATNINEALVDGLEFMNSFASGNQSMVIFLTDGEASTGTTNNDAILANVQSRNIYDIPIYSLAFGNDADWAFVKKVALQSNGIGRRIYEDSDAALQISGFYREISTPVLSGVEFKYLEDAANQSTVTKTSFRNIFNGSEVIVAGQMAKEDTGVMSLVVSGNNGDGGVDLKLKADVDELNPVDDIPDVKIVNSDEVTEKIWAFLTIKDLLKKYDGETDEATKESLKKQALELSLKYNFVTPLTSMVVVQFEDDDRDERPLQDEEETEGQDAYNRGGWNSRGGRDPHFMVKTAKLDDHLCFDVTGEPNDVIQIISDPQSGLIINIKINHGNNSDGHGGKRAYIEEIAVLIDGVTLLADVGGIKLNHRKYTWSDVIFLKVPSCVVASQHSNRWIRVGLDTGFGVVIFKHVAGEGRTGGDSFLNIELDREGKLSKHTSGLLGQFVHKRITMHRAHKQEERVVSRMSIKTKTGFIRALVVLQTRLDPVEHKRLRCWYLPSGTPLFHISHEDFVVASVTSK